MQDNQNKNTKELLISNFKPQKSSLLQSLHMIQKENGFVSENDMLVLSRYLKVSKSEIYGAITSYPEIHTSINSELQECASLTCYIKNDKISDKTTDCKFKCFEGPIAIQNHNIYSKSNGKFIKTNSLKTPIIDSSGILDKPVLLDNISQKKNFESYNSIYKFDALRKTLNKKPLEIINIIEESGLKGRGGAYFPTATKWKMASGKKSIQKYLIVNCEEGEPGVFKDRLIMENMPYMLIEGAIIAAYANNCSDLVFYINGEAEKSFQTLKNSLIKMEQNNIIDKNGMIFDSDYKIKIKLESGAGGYVCGEETTLLNTMEGNRREPRLKPPFPTEKGVFSLPTIINNAETLCNVTYILNHSVREYKKIGIKDFPGTKLLSVSGHFKMNGIIEIPMGITINDLLDKVKLENHSDKIKYLAIGGPSSGLLPRSEFDTSLKGGFLNSSGIMMGAGGFIGINSTIDPIDVIINLAEYNADESCGKCTPCREGTPRLVEQLKQIKLISDKEKYKDELNLLAETVNLASLCGLGQAAGNPIISYLKYFYD
jgi:NADH-quinone oxidoreductase subunit F